MNVCVHARVSVCVYEYILVYVHWHVCVCVPVCMCVHWQRRGGSEGVRVQMCYAGDAMEARNRDA